MNINYFLFFFALVNPYMYFYRYISREINIFLGIFTPMPIVFSTVFVLIILYSLDRIYLK